MRGYGTTPLKDLTNRKSKDSPLKKSQKIAKKSLNGELSFLTEVVSAENSKESLLFSPTSLIPDAESQTIQISKESLNGALSSVIEDVSAENGKESSLFSPISQISDAESQIRQISDSILSPDLSASTESAFDLTTAANISTITDEPGSVSPRENSGLIEVSSGSVEVLEADIVVNLLKKARTEVLNSDLQSKKVLDALIEVSLKEFYAVPEGKDWFTDYVSMRGHLVCLCFFLLSFAASMVFLFGFGSQSSYCKPFPT